MDVAWTGLANLDEAYRAAMARGGFGGSLGVTIEAVGLEGTRPVTMSPATLETVISLLLRRALAASCYGDRIEVQARQNEIAEVPLMGEAKWCRCVRLSVVDEGLPVDSNAVARAARSGTGELDPGFDALGWVCFLVARAGGRVDVGRSEDGGTQINCFLPMALDA